MSLVFAWMGADDDGNDDDLDDDDDPLNSEDDDEEDSEEALNTENLVLCQYDKVTRTKNKWKAQLKFGVSHHPLSACACAHIHHPFLFPYLIIFPLHKCLQIFLNLEVTRTLHTKTSEIVDMCGRLNVDR